MDSVIDMSAARALVGDAALWPQVRAFLWDFSPQVHGSWLEGLFPEEGVGPLVRRLSASPRVKSFVLSSLGVKPLFHVFPKDDWSRLALLDGATLLDVAKWLGAVACCDRLRFVTKGADVRALKAELSGVYPEVFSYTMYFGGLDLGFADAPGEDAESRSALSEEVVSTGVSIVFSLLSGIPEGVVSRLVLKLPKVLGAAAHPRGMKKPGDAAKSIRKILKLKFPEAYKLCC